MKRLLRLVPVAVAVSLVVPAMGSTVAAQTVDQQRERVEQIVDELERLQEEANRIAEDYVEAIDTKRQLDAEIVDAEEAVAEQEAELAEVRDSLGDMALRSFVGGGATPLGPLFEDSSNLSDALQREELARVALSAGNVTTDELNAMVADLQSDKLDLERKREQADQLAATLTEAQSETESLTAEYTQARTEAEAKLGQLIQEEEERRARESARRLQAEVAAAQAASSNSSSTSPGGGGSGGGSGGGGSGGGGSGGGGSAPAASGGTSSGSGGSGATAAPAVSSRSGLAVQAALSQQGVPYRYATSRPGVSFDCSGLTKYAWAQAGVYLPHQSRAQYASIPHVPKGSAQPGDLIFFYSPISHVSVYLGNGMQVHAPNTGSVVNVASVNWGKVTGVGRPG